ncbi:AraC family transcriptional regulator [Mucilaginibacter hurinus]|uniref:AraC family transcriptional regulator n=1 Tax=Mucilaginibacter hurinus TaxID=2201324 RepID=A0A367GKX1_9SPHI|nr:AraC family transcriptional regulator [Mucilaginibacter hurinus]RCH54132.1 AraC family transcriptional regulator [Mucilaginibacter hurinus]
MKKGFPVYDICTLSEYQQHDILVDRFAHYLAKHHDLHFPHKHNFYHLVYFSKGSGTHHIDFKSFTVKPGQIYFMVPGQVHSWFFEGETDGYIINFSETLFNSFLLKQGYLDNLPFFSGDIDDAVVNLSGKNKSAVSHLFEEIINETQQPDRYSFDAVRILMMRIFTVIARTHINTANTPQVSYNHTLLTNFRRLIEQNFVQSKLPKDYAALLYITPNHLNAICNDILGTPAGELIRQRVILEAKRMLVNPKTTIGEIAGYLGFDDNSYFTRFFKKQAGVTPEEFRHTLK